MPVEPNQQISITLEAQQWNTVLQQLAKGPYEVVAPLMQAVATQANAAGTPEETPPANEALPASPPPPPTKAKANGQAKHA